MSHSALIALTRALQPNDTPMPTLDSQKLRLVNAVIDWAGMHPDDQQTADVYVERIAKSGYLNVSDGWFYQNVGQGHAMAQSEVFSVPGLQDLPIEAEFLTPVALPVPQPELGQKYIHQFDAQGHDDPQSPGLADDDSSYGSEHFDPTELDRECSPLLSPLQPPPCSPSVAEHGDDSMIGNGALPWAIYDDEEMLTDDYDATRFPSLTRARNPALAPSQQPLIPYDHIETPDFAYAHACYDAAVKASSAAPAPAPTQQGTEQFPLVFPELDEIHAPQPCSAAKLPADLWDWDDEDEDMSDDEDMSYGDAWWQVEMELEEVDAMRHQPEAETGLDTEDQELMLEWLQEDDAAEFFGEEDSMQGQGVY